MDCCAPCPRPLGLDGSPSCGSRRHERFHTLLNKAASGLPQRFPQLAGDSLRPLCSRLEESQFDASWEIFWKLCVISLTRCKCGTSMKCVEELRALIQSERNWIMLPGKSSPRRSAQVLQWLTHSFSLLCWMEETVCWSGRGRRLRARFFVSRSLPAVFYNSRASPTALCLMKRLTQLLRGSVTNAQTAWCATMLTPL